MSELLASNEWYWRLARTIVQGVLGVVIANIDLIMGWCVMDPSVRALVMALVMAVLSPIMAVRASSLTSMTALFFELERITPISVTTPVMHATMIDSIKNCLPRSRLSSPGRQCLTASQIQF